MTVYHWNPDHSPYTGAMPDLSALELEVCDDGDGYYIIDGIGQGRCFQFYAVRGEHTATDAAISEWESDREEREYLWAEMDWNDRMTRRAESGYSA